MFSFSNPILAHPGNTDSLGCHTCRTNCSSWGLYVGEYHCHQSKGTTQPSDPIHSTWGDSGTGYTTPAPEYYYPSYTTTPTCPTMSYYDSLSGNCKCMSGYIVDVNMFGKETCVSADQKCHDQLGYDSRYNVLKNVCECSYGYVISNGKCISEDDYCKNLFGYGAKYNTLKDKCECRTGYVFNNIKCTFDSSSTSDDYSLQDNSSVCPQNSTISSDKKCYCNSGYVLNSNKNGCEIKTCPLNSLLIGAECVCNEGYVPKNNICITYTEDCKISFGENVFGNKNINVPNSSSCYCNDGYQWTSDMKSCILKQGIFCSENSTLANDNKCYCNAGFIFDGVSSKCIKKPAKGQEITIKEFIDKEKNNLTKIDEKLTNKLKGKILLQVENSGQAWYVNPKDGRRTYMANGDRAYNAMRNLGVGITDKDLDKLKNNSDLAKKQAGKIFLKIQDKGQAYYVNFDGKLYYLKDGDEAYKVMRTLGLGIKNGDLNRILISE